MSRAGRPSVRDHQAGVGYYENADFPEQHGELVACHDGTPSIDFPCLSCGEMSHMHESQVPSALMPSAEMGVRCHACKAPMVVVVGPLRRAFAEARKRMEATT